MIIQTGEVTLGLYTPVELIINERGRCEEVLCAAIQEVNTASVIKLISSPEGS